MVGFDGFCKFRIRCYLFSIIVFISGFSSIEWGNGYTEGNSWHHSFPSYAIIPPYDVFEKESAGEGSGDKGYLRGTAIVFVALLGVSVICLLKRECCKLVLRDLSVL
jgi:hypothetical protein